MYAYHPEPIGQYDLHPGGLYGFLCSAEVIEECNAWPTAVAWDYRVVTIYDPHQVTEGTEVPHLISREDVVNFSRHPLTIDGVAGH